MPGPLHGNLKLTLVLSLIILCKIIRAENIFTPVKQHFKVFYKKKY